MAPSATTTREARASRRAAARALLAAAAADDEEEDEGDGEAMKVLPGMRRLSAMRAPGPGAAR
jgi:hypothetical protein